MKDLTLISKRHQRYEKGFPVMEIQHCGRAFIIKNSNFVELMNGAPVSPSEGFLVRLINTDNRDANGNYLEMMQPKLMEVVSRDINKIELRGVKMEIMDVIGADFSNYSMTLYLVSNKVEKCVFHLLDRHIDIEYLDIE